MLVFDDAIFIHIPKVGGTSVRRTFSNLLNSTPVDNYFDANVKNDRDINHLTLNFIKINSEKLWLDLNKAQKYCLVRDPRDRLFSSFSQYVSMFTESSIENLTLEQMFGFFERLLNGLEEQFSSRRLQFDKEYVHFQPQVDYIFQDNKLFVENIYPLENIAGMTDSLAQQLNVGKVIIQRENFTVRHRYALLHELFKRQERIYKSAKIYMPNFLKPHLKKLIYREGIGKEKQIFMERFGHDIVDRYYREDEILYRKLTT